MADLRNQLAEIYVKVVADTKAADKSLKDKLDGIKDQMSGLQDLYDKSAKAQEKLSKLSEEQAKKQSKRILKEFGLAKLIDEDRVKRLKEFQKRYEDLEKRRVEEAKKNARKIERVEQYIQNKLIKFRDYAGKLDDEELKRTDARNVQKAASYESFLKRASSEHSRYAARLDQRDMTTNMIENLRRGFEKGVLISNKWHRDENTMQRVARGIEVAGTAFHKIRGPAQMAATKFQTMQRVAYALQAVIGSIAGSIGSLVAGLMALIGVLGQASFALIAIGSSFASIGAGAIAAKIALGGVGQAVSGLLDQQNSYNRSLRDAKRAFRDLRFEVEEAALSEEEAAINLERAREELARVQDLPPDTRARREVELQFQQAELSYRRAKARSKDAREDLKKGPLGGRGVQDPLAKLTASQKVFARYLASLKPQLDTLKEAAASGFLPILQQAISVLVAKALPTLTIGLNTLGTAMGNAAKSFSDAFTTPENLELLRDFFEASKPLIETFGRAAGNVFGGILGVLKAAQPLTDRFADWVEKVSENFEKLGKSSNLQSFLNLAGDVAASLGSVFGSVFGGLNNLVKNTFGGTAESGAGGILLAWLQKIADGFKAFTGNTEFAGWLKASTENATTALSAIGALLKPIMDIAAMPEIGEFWTVLRGAAEPIKKLLEDGAKAGPEFAALLVSLMKMFATLSDSGALEAFFNTLKAIADAMTGLLTLLKPVLDFIGRIHGAFLAVGLALIVARGFMLIFSGITATVVKTVGGVAAAMGSVSVKTMVAGMKFRQLRTDGATLGQALNGVVSGFTRTAAKAAATRRAALLVQMAKDAGMAKHQLDILEMQLNDVIVKQGIYSRGGMVAAVKAQNAQLSQSKALGAASAGSRFGGGRAAAGLAGGAMLMGSMATGGSATTSTLAGAAMIASFLPGPLGLISGAVLGIGAAISSGFDAAAQEEKRKREAEQKRKIEIRAEKAELYAKEVTQQKALGQTLIGAGAKTTDIQAIRDAATSQIIQSGVKFTGKIDDAFQGILDAGFADVFAGKDSGLKTGIIDAIGKLTKTGFYDVASASAELNTLFDEAGGGKAGITAIEKFIKDRKIGDRVLSGITDETGEFTGEAKVVTPQERGANEFRARAKARFTGQIMGIDAALKMSDKQLLDTKELTKVQRIFGFAKYGDLYAKGYLTETATGGYKVNFTKIRTDLGKLKTGFSGAISAGDLQFNARGFMSNVTASSGSLPTNTSIADKTANTNANAATTMSNAANVLANVANVATKQPTYIVYNVTSKGGKTNALDLFAGTGVNPIPFSGVYP